MIRPQQHSAPRAAPAKTGARTPQENEGDAILGAVAAERRAAELGSARLLRALVAYHRKYHPDSAVAAIGFPRNAKG